METSKKEEDSAGKHGNTSMSDTLSVWVFYRSIPVFENVGFSNLIGAIQKKTIFTCHVVSTK